MFTTRVAPTALMVECIFPESVRCREILNALFSIGDSDLVMNVGTSFGLVAVSNDAY